MKKLVEQLGGRMTVGYQRQPVYKELFHAFEQVFVRDGRIEALMAPLALDLPPLVPKSQGGEKREPTIGGITLCFKGRYFKTLNDFCTQSGYTNPQRGPRARLMGHKFKAVDTLWFARGCAQNLHKQLDADVSRGLIDVAGSDLEELCLVADLPASKRQRVRERGVLLYDMDKLEEVATR